MKDDNMNNQFTQQVFEEYFLKNTEVLQEANKFYPQI